MLCPSCNGMMETCKTYHDFACPKCGLAGPFSVVASFAVAKRRLATAQLTISALRTQLRERGSHG